MNFDQIASSLIEASEDKSAAPRDFLEELFPYIYTASKRMSGREISEFLERNHGVKISQPTISRALKEPEKYTKEFARSAYENANAVRFLMNLEEIRELLTSVGFAGFLLRKVRDSIPDTSTLSSEYELTVVQDCLNELLSNWFKINQDFRDLCWPEILRLDEERKGKNGRL